MLLAKEITKFQMFLWDLQPMAKFSQRCPSTLFFHRDKTFRQMPREPAGPWSAAGSAPLLEGETDTMSNTQKNTLKWEKEESLGEAATVAPVLYTNMNFPGLKEEFPGKIQDLQLLKVLSAHIPWRSSAFLQCYV